MSSSNYSHSFSVNQVGFSKSVDTFVNIQKRKEDVLFRANSHVDNVNLAYLQQQEISVEKNLSIVDRSSSLISNKTFSEYQYQKLEGITGFSIETDAFLVTDIFTSDLRTQEEIPLFWEHVLSKELNPGESYVEIKLLDYSLKPIIDSTYLSDHAAGKVYSNLQNSFDKITGLFDLFFISYSIKQTSGILKKYLEILSNAPVFKEADIDDIDLDTGYIKAGRKVYLIEEVIGADFNITLPSESTYGLNRFSNNRIQILAPETTSTEEPWFVRLKAGKFLDSGVTGINKYYVPEFLSQTFNPFQPYKTVIDSGTRITNRIIKLNKTNVLLDSSQLFYPEVLVTKEDGTFKFAISSNPALRGTETSLTGSYFSNTLLGDSSLSGAGINSLNNQIASSSIDSMNGIIVLPLGYEVSETDVIEASYIYEEKEFEITTFDFNPLTSSDLIDKRVVFLLLPEKIGSTITSALRYLVVNEDGLVIDTDIEEVLNGVDLTTVTSSGIFYDRDPATCFWAPVGAVDFVKWSTVEGSSNLDDILILGDVYVREHMSPGQVVINDVRVRGGGLKESEVENAIAINPEAQWYWDNSTWEGLSYPGAASIFVDIPVEVLEIAGGTLTPENVTSIVRKHIAHGVYPVIHGYNLYETTITGMNYGIDGSITVMWAPGPTDAFYDIYFGSNDAYDLIASGLDTNEYTFSGMLNQDIAVIGYNELEDTAYLSGSIFDIQSLSTFGLLSNAPVEDISRLSNTFTLSMDTESILSNTFILDGILTSANLAQEFTLLGINLTLEESFEYDESWSGTINDAEYYLAFGFSSPNTKSDSFESGEGW